MLSARHVQTTVAGLMARYTARPSATQEAIVSVWLDDLDGLSDEELTAAVRAHTRDPGEGRFWPTPAHLVGQLERLRTVQIAQSEGSALTPLQEWQKVLDVLGTFGGCSDFNQRRRLAHLGADLLESVGGHTGFQELGQLDPTALSVARCNWLKDRDRQRAQAAQARRLAPVLEVLTGGGQVTERRASGFLSMGETLPARVGGAR